MSKRYYISPIVGDGTEENPYRAKISDHGEPWVGVIPTDPVTGVPVNTWALVRVSAVNHTDILKDLSVDALPDVSLDLKTSAIGNKERGGAQDTLTKHGISSVTIGQADSYREFVDGIGRELDPTFTTNNFDVQ